LLLPSSAQVKASYYAQHYLLVPYGSHWYDLQVRANDEPLLVIGHVIRIAGGSETRHHITANGVKLVGRYLDEPTMAEENEEGFSEDA